MTNYRKHLKVRQNCLDDEELDLSFDLKGKCVSNSSWNEIAINDTSLSEQSKRNWKGEESRTFSDDSFNHSTQAYNRFYTHIYFI